MIRILLVLVCLLATVGFVAAEGHNTEAASAPSSVPAAGATTTDALQPQLDAGGDVTTEETPMGMGSGTWIFLGLMLAFMYFVMIRPQGKEQKRRKAMMGGIKVGDKVVTIGGIHGVIDRKGEEDVDVKVTDGTLITFNLGAVSQVVQDGEKIKGQE